MAITSLPSRERGLKYFGSIGELIAYESLPSRERGLKFFHRYAKNTKGRVAPFTGEWIERAILILVHTLRLISKMMLQNLPKNDKSLLEMK